jgi:hypothetical protein
MSSVQRWDDVSLAVKTTLSHLAVTASKASPSLIRKTGRAVTVRSKRLENPLIVFDIDDTLVTEDEATPAAGAQPLPEVVALLKRLRAVQCRIFLVTARHTSARSFTVQQLTSVGVQPSLYDELFLAPEQYRKSMRDVGIWKKMVRQSLANKFGEPILLTVGDQWTDLISVNSLRELEHLNSAFGSAHTPFILCRLDDGVGFFGLKLRG